MDRLESGETVGPSDGDGPKRVGKAKSSLGPRKAKSPHLRKRSVLPTNLVSMLGDVSDLKREADEFDKMDTADVDEFEIDEEIQQGIDYARGEKEAVAAVLGIEKEEYIRKSTYFTQSADERSQFTGPNLYSSKPDVVEI